MSLTTLINRPCTIVRRLESATVDEYGDEVPAESEVETVWELQQRSRSEDEQEAETSDTGWLAFFPVGTDLRTGDKVIDGETTFEYELTGDPEPKRNPRTQAYEQVEASVRRIAGSWDAS